MAIRDAGFLFKEQTGRQNETKKVKHKRIRFYRHLTDCLKRVIVVFFLLDFFFSNRISKGVSDDWKKRNHKNEYSYTRINMFTMMKPGGELNFQFVQRKL